MSTNLESLPQKTIPDIEDIIIKKSKSEEGSRISQIAKFSKLAKFSKADFMIELYHIFNESLISKPVKDFDEVQALYQSILAKMMSRHKLKKLFNNGSASKTDLYEIYQELVQRKVLPSNSIVETILTSKLVRSSSGVLPISLALDGRVGSCNDDCSMCPDECIENGAEQDIARSYLSSEGTFIRGKIQDFSIVEQTWRRLAELEAMGHPPDKLEFILLGGTFDCFPISYRFQTSLDIFYACNVYRYVSVRFNGEHSVLLQEWFGTNPFATASPLSKKLTDFLYAIRSRPICTDLSQKEIDKLLVAEQLLNTKATCCRVIGMVAETRPDRINRYSMTDLRKLGCTRIQIGIQTDNDYVLAFNKRGHKVAASIKANREVRDNGFKIDGHIMPDLPGTTLEIDYAMVKRVFLGNDLQLDYCKIYPCLDLPFTEIRKWKESGKWTPIAENRFPEFMDFMAYTMSIVPPWTRINRVHRDFPEASVKNHGLGFVSDTIRSNLQQMVTGHMEKRGLKCYDIRSREVRNAIIDTQLGQAQLYIRTYRANEGTEFFISVEIPGEKSNFDDTTLLGLCRLRIPDFEFTDKEQIPFHYLPVYRNKEICRIARIRELHVYGNIASLSTDGNSQHRGIGTFLMRAAESISRLFNCTIVTVISGVGVRDYYEHLGYSLDTHDDQYMIKYLTPYSSNLTLFGKTYNIDIIEEKIRNSIIAQKYIYVTSHIYGQIQNGEAQGFAFTGEIVKVEKEGIHPYAYLLYLFPILLGILLYYTLG
jgi:ELP3 family radical SAM enzyme/protein acetyltransferase